jgi:hypothetical protein
VACSSPRAHDVVVVLMVVLAGVLLVGITLTLRWVRVDYQPWAAGDRNAAGGASSTDDVPLSVEATTRSFLRGAAVAAVGGFWAGALVTGPAVRLIMRLLAVTAGDDAQGMITEADEVVGAIELDGTIGLYLFAGVLPGLLSGLIYVVIRRWLPGGVLTGITFGALHLILLATRLDPLRPDNADFDIVGPGWLSVLTFSLVCLLHGMAVVAVANRYSHAFPPRAEARSERIRVLLPLVLPALIFVPGAILLAPVFVALGITLLASRSTRIVRAIRSRAALVAGRLALAAVVLVLLPTTVADLADIVDRTNGEAAPRLVDH